MTIKINLAPPPAKKPFALSVPGPTQTVPAQVFRRSWSAVAALSTQTDWFSLMATCRPWLRNAATSSAAAFRAALW